MISSPPPSTCLDPDRADGGPAEASRPLTVAIIGPSASGKSSVVRELARRGVVTVHPSWTTRPRRPDEVAGSLEHRFVDDATFDSLAADGFFHETVEMFGLAHRYGIPPFRPTRDATADLVMLRAPLVDHFRQHVTDRARVVVYLVEGDQQQARRWLVARGCQADDLHARVRDNTAEVEVGRRIADRTFRNDDTIELLASRIAAAVADDRALVGLEARS